MPLVNYCRKCKAEVPLGESCPYCGGKLSQSGRQLSFGAARTPVRDWFGWNGFLRVILPVLAAVFAITLLAEGMATGLNGIAALLKQGFFWQMVGLLAAALGVCWLMLTLQGPENVHYVVEQQGVQIRTYLADPTPVQLYARFLSPGSVEELAQSDSRPPLEGLTLVRSICLPWAAVRRVRIWREESVLLFYRPSFWQAAAVRCPVEELEQAEELVRRKLKRFPQTRVYPLEAKKKPKSR